MTLSPPWRQVLLTAHIVTSVGWIGAVGGFLALAITGLDSRAALAGQAAYLAMDVITTFVIVPLAVTSVVIGVVQALLTPWGLLRHYWVVIKLVLTVVSTVVLLLTVESVRVVAQAAAASAWNPAELIEVRQSLVAHAAGGLGVLLVATVLSVFKPRGRTPLSRRGL